MKTARARLPFSLFVDKNSYFDGSGREIVDEKNDSYGAGPKHSIRIMIPMARDAKFLTKIVIPIARDAKYFIKIVIPIARDAKYSIQIMIPIALDAPYSMKIVIPIARDAKYSMQIMISRIRTFKPTHLFAHSFFLGARSGRTSHDDSPKYAAQANNYIVLHEPESPEREIH